MTLNEVMQELASLGTAQNRKLWALHGAPENQFGVPFADLNKFQKRIKFDQQLALELWETGNADARIFATMIADPKKIELATLDRWLADCNYYGITDAVSRYIAANVANINVAAERWIKSDHEWTSTAGWTVIAVLAQTPESSGGLPDAYFLPFISKIEAGIHTAKNRTKHSMNMTLCAFGISREDLREEVFAAAKKIGKVNVNHGLTNCKTPEIVSYVQHAITTRKPRK